MKKLMMFLMLLSISAFSMGCTKPEGDMAKPAETTEEGEGSEKEGMEEEDDAHDHADGEGHEKDEDKTGTE